MDNKRSLVSTPFFTKLKALFQRKLLSTSVATLSMALILWGASAARNSSVMLSEPVESEAASAEQVLDIAPRGLSRQRKDFDRALELLAGAAASDNSLAQYFERVQKRVNGEMATPEKGSGVRTIAPKKRASARVSASVGSEAAEGQGGAESGVVNKVKGFIGAAMASDGKPSASGDDLHRAASGVGDAGKSEARLIVGDIVYESNPAIDKWVGYYTTTAVGRRTMEIGINRSDAYLEMARAEFRRAGVPEDLVWLAFVESVWHPGAMSPAAAGGIWQFIPKTATEYGLTVSKGYDERFDPMKQTKVAAAYLRDLYTIFGDWTLAMAAYNCGEPRVMDAVIKNGRANFWDLHARQLLPQETRNYVPKILAAIRVAGKADVYGFAEETAGASENDAASAGQ